MNRKLHEHSMGLDPKGIENMNIIGIGGPRGAGKTTLAKDISALSNKVFHRMAHTLPIALPLKQCGQYLLNNWLKAEEQKEEEFMPGVSPRTLWRNIGQTMRELNPDFWINLWELQRKREGIGSYEVYIIDDIRHTNEIEMVKRADQSMLIWVDGPENEDNHPSERSLEGSMFPYRTEHACGRPHAHYVYLSLEINRWLESLNDKDT